MQFRSSAKLQGSRHHHSNCSACLCKMPWWGVEERGGYRNQWTNQSYLCNQTTHITPFVAFRIGGEIMERERDKLLTLACIFPPPHYYPDWFCVVTLTTVSFVCKRWLIFFHHFQFHNNFIPLYLVCLSNFPFSFSKYSFSFP